MNFEYSFFCDIYFALRRYSLRKLFWRLYLLFKLCCMILGGCLLPSSLLVWFIGTVCASQFYLQPQYVKGKEYLDEFKQIGRGAIIFNHPTFHDFLVLCFALNHIPKMVVNETYMVGPLKWIAWRFGFICISPKKERQSCSIINAMQKEQIVISPVGHIHQDHKPFHRSIFYAQQPILPVLLTYSELTIWDKETLLNIVLFRMHGPWIFFQVEFKPVLYPRKQESPATFCERVETQMKLYHEENKKKRNIN